MCPDTLNGVICYIGVGSNLGDPLNNCKCAIDILSHVKGIDFKKVSSYYETEPVGIEKQNYFINAVVEIKTDFSAKDLLGKLMNIERIMGRKFRFKGGPRLIDLDILFYGQEVISERNIEIPHPEIHKRRFVLEPLCEIASYFIHPSFGISMRGLKDRLKDKKIVRKIETSC